MKMKNVLLQLGVLIGLLLGLSASLRAASLDSQDGLILQETYGILKRDLRKCVSPMCGGYWLKPLNSVGIEQYFNGLELRDEQAIDDGELGLLIVKGHAGSVEPLFNTRSFVVDAVYRLESPSKVPSESVFASLSLRTPPHACLVAPCPNILARILNQTAVKAFDQLDTRQLGTGEPWETLVYNQSTIVAGYFEKGTVLFPGGYERFFKLNGLYRLQD